MSRRTAIAGEYGVGRSSFQATWTPEDAAEIPDPPLFYCTWSRELHDSDELFPESRAVQIQWAFDADPGALDDLEVWSDEFPDLDSFFRRVEASPQFKALIESDSIGELYTVEPRYDEVVRRGSGIIRLPFERRKITFRCSAKVVRQLSGRRLQRRSDGLVLRRCQAGSVCLIVGCTAEWVASAGRCCAGFVSRFRRESGIRAKRRELTNADGFQNDRSIMRHPAERSTNLAAKKRCAWSIYPSGAAQLTTRGRQRRVWARCGSSDTALHRSIDHTRPATPRLGTLRQHGPESPTMHESTHEVEHIAVRCMRRQPAFGSGFRMANRSRDPGAA